MGNRQSQEAAIRPQTVLFFGKAKSRTHTTGALVEALRENGLEVHWLNCDQLKRWLGRAGMRFWVRRSVARRAPHLCFAYYHDLPAELMRELAPRIPTVVWVEEPVAGGRFHREYVRDARLVCLSSPRLVRGHREDGVENATFMLSGFSPRYHHPLEDTPAPERCQRDLAFIGSPGHARDRPAFLAWLSEHHDLEVFGREAHWRPYLSQYPALRYRGEADPAAYAEICARSRIVLGLDHDEPSPRFFSNRPFLTLACRGFHLTRYVPGAEDVFQDGVHLAWFRSREECLAKIAHYLAHPDERARIAAAGHALVSEQHRYRNRIADILAILALEQELACPDDPVSGAA